MVRNLPANAGNMGSIPGSGRSLEEELATHSSILAGKISWTEEPDRLQSMGCKESDTTKQLNTHKHKYSMEPAVVIHQIGITLSAATRSLWRRLVLS